MRIKNNLKQLLEWVNEPMEFDFSGLFPSKREDVTLKIIPDKTLNNDNVESLAISLAELYSPLKLEHRIKISRNSFTIDHKNTFIFEIYFSVDSIIFFITGPKKWEELIKSKLEEVFSTKIGIQEVERNINFNESNSEAIELILSKNEFMSLKTDKRILAPIPNLMSTVKLMKEDDKALLQVILDPLGPNWGEKAEENYRKYKRGEMPGDRILNYKRIIELICIAGLSVTNGIINVILEIITGEPGENYVEEVKKNKRPEELSSSSASKYSKRAFNVGIRLLSESKDRDRARLVSKNLTSAFNDLSEDNELVAKKIISNSNKAKFIKKIEQKEISRFRTSKLSTTEIAKFIQLPTSSLQNEYCQIESIGYNTPNLPKEFREPGVLMGEINYRNQVHNVYMPDDDYDLLTRPLGIIGPVKSGKSVLGSNIALEAFLKGYGAAVIDVADGKLCEDIKGVIPKELNDKVVELDFGNISRPIGVNWSEVTRSLKKSENRLAGELVSWFEKFTGELGPRTRRWLKKSALAVFEDPDNTILEVVSMLVDDSFRANIIPNIRNQSVKASWIMFNQLSPGEKNQIIQPILNRLDYLLDDENLKNCLCQKAKKDSAGEDLINFRRWMDEGYLVLIKAPVTILGESTTDAIISFLVSKIWLSALTRIDIRANGIIPNPFILLMDEPHQFMGSSENWKRMIVEARKWGLKLVYLFHSFAQIKEKDKTLANLFKASGMSFILFNGSKETFVDLKEEISPYTIDEALSLPQYYAVYRFYGNKGPITFIAKAPAPPKRRYKIQDNDHISKQSILTYGEDSEIVELDIFQRESSLLDIDILSVQQATINTGHFEISTDVEMMG